MKLSTLFAKLTSMNTRTLSTLGGLALTAAALTLATPAANAQQFGIGVQFGGPRYVTPATIYPAYGYSPANVAPRYGYAPGYWQERRAEEWRAHEWREHAFREHGYWDHRGYNAYYGR